MNNDRLRLYTITALMIAISVVLPVFMPIIDILGWTGTLASHVPVFLSMFIAPFDVFDAYPIKASTNNVFARDVFSDYFRVEIPREKGVWAEFDVFWHWCFTCVATTASRHQQQRNRVYKKCFFHCCP